MSRRDISPVWFFLWDSMMWNKLSLLCFENIVMLIQVMYILSFFCPACRREGHESHLKKSGTYTLLNFSHDISLIFAGRWINARVVINWEEW